MSTEAEGTAAVEALLNGEQERPLTRGQMMLFRLASEECVRLARRAEELRAEADKAEEHLTATRAQAVLSIREDLGLAEETKLTFAEEGNVIVVKWNVPEELTPDAIIGHIGADASSEQEQAAASAEVAEP